MVLLFVYLVMFESQFFIDFVFQDTYFCQQFPLKILGLEESYLRVIVQQKLMFLIRVARVLDYFKDWVVVPKSHRQLVLTELRIDVGLHAIF